ncbi:permease [Oecophyllibacter saccharovorans]|uniref:permease n=1 Tax=Oecophyllibacter saccharovorans TaxID=2558360 RepID=UPI0011664FB4|nr:permease [Oecophyllibacter saccharovorans]TPW35258.1 permease [Oecophyllibacter saccharovorans]
MNRAQHRGALRLCSVLAVALLFLLQLAFHTALQPGEHPRAAMLRLTGWDIAPTSAPYSHTAVSLGHTMTMHSPEVCPEHKAHTGPDKDKTCPLCPLLEHVLLALTPLLLAISVAGRVQWLRFLPAVPRGPPELQHAPCPPGRGPPALRTSLCTGARPVLRFPACVFS